MYIYIRERERWAGAPDDRADGTKIHRRDLYMHVYICTCIHIYMYIYIYIYIYTYTYTYTYTYIHTDVFIHDLLRRVRRQGLQHLKIVLINVVMRCTCITQMYIYIYIYIYIRIERERDS